MVTRARVTAEQKRLTTEYTAWTRWGPYLAERSWGTVREDYSADGDAWRYFPHDHARSRVYRWNEDGLAGISDDEGRFCFALALWNEHDPYLKERLFGLSNPQGNHGEDVKEVYFYLDSTPTHSYMKMLYRYPQAAFPYDQLLEENARRGKDDPEYELPDTGIFDDQRYFDVVVEYAKASPFDILIRIRATNHGPDPAPLYLLPTLWFRNTWAWQDGEERPLLYAESAPWPNVAAIVAHHWLPKLQTHEWILGTYALYCEAAQELLFTENESNTERLFGTPNPSSYVKDAFHRYVVEGEQGSVNPNHSGTKAAALYQHTVAAGDTLTIRLRLKALVERGGESPVGELPADAPPAPQQPVLPSALPSMEGEAGEPSPFSDFDRLFAQRQQEADEFYASLQAWQVDVEDEQRREALRRVQRQALAGMLWSKQFYHYIVARWLEGDPTQPPPPPERRTGRNSEWRHFFAERVFSMPDKWEFPWFAAWDLAFHCLPLTLVDPRFAKYQLDRLLREWSQHPNGQVPAYEWNFSDVNPPVLAWAAWRVYKLEQKHTGQADRAFLERVFHKLLLTFTWWVNRKDADGNNVFEGGFLGLDNIGIFDRNTRLPGGARLEQSDGTAWMGLFSLSMMTIALELAHQNPVYQSIATKFFEHFLSIAHAIQDMGHRGLGLWDEEDGFFYDAVHLPGESYRRIKVRSMVGLTVLFAVATVDEGTLEELPGFRRRLEWYLNYRPDLDRLVAHWNDPQQGWCRLLALVRDGQLRRVLQRLLDPAEFLSPYGIRSLSKYHEAHPYIFRLAGTEHEIGYEPGVSRSNLFGGNSNWRGPVWFPLNYLLIESLRTYHDYYGDTFTIAYPTGADNCLTLGEVADHLSQRLIGLFLPDETGQPPFARGFAESDHMPEGAWHDPLLFYEYFHGDSGAGLGASHQTGWTGLVANLIQEQAGQPGEQLRDDDHDL
ncbi:MAG: glucosidase [Chloroflexota bacterium]|nr:glucosidase [Chloroflexota bacterium]